MSGPASQTALVSGLVAPTKSPVDVLADEALHQFRPVRIEESSDRLDHQVIEIVKPPGADQCLHLAEQVWWITIGGRGQHADPKLRLKALRLQIKAGADAIKRGDFADIEEADLERYLERHDDDAALVAAGLMRKGTGKLPASFWRARGPRVPLDVAVAAVSADRVRIEWHSGTRVRSFPSVAWCRERPKQRPFVCFDGRVRTAAAALGFSVRP